MNVWILCNQYAGRSLSEEMLCRLVRQAGHTVAGFVIKGSADPRRPQHDVDLIVAAGGDGTVKMAASLVAGTSTPLAILPLGTANNIAATLGIVADVPHLISSWRDARRASIDIGYARTASKEWLVMEGAGAGLIPAGIAAAQRALVSASENAAVELAAAQRVFHEVARTLAPVRKTIAIDGTTFEEDVLMFEVLNMRSVGPGLVLAPDADPSDGLFDVIIAAATHRRELLDYIESCIDRSNRPPLLPVYRARHVRIDSCEELHIDDERIDMCGLGDIHFTIAARAATVLI